MAYSSGLPAGVISSRAGEACPSNSPDSLVQGKSPGFARVRKIARYFTGSPLRRRGGEYEPLLGERTVVDEETFGSKPAKPYERQWVLCGTVYGLILL